MAASRIESHGFTIGGWWFPPFSVGRGECLLLRLPHEAWVDQDRILAYFAGAGAVDGLTLPPTVEIAKWAFRRHGWRRWLSDPTAFDWLKKNTTLSPEATRAFLREHGIEQDIPLSRCAGTARALLGLAAALAKKPEAVVFSTAGLDPLGAEAVKRIVAANLPACIAVYLAWAFISQGHEHYPDFPNAHVVTVFAKSEALAPPQLYG